MKFGVHLSTFTKTWDEDVLQYIPLAKSFGYDGVEFPLMDPDQFPIRDAKTMLADAGMACTCGTGLNLERDISSLDRDIEANGIEHLKKCIQICHELGSDCLGGVLYAPWGQHMTREEGQRNIDKSLSNLFTLGQYAREEGVVLALEMLNRYESYFLNTVEDGKTYVKQISHPNVKLHFDTFHANIEEKSMKESIILGGADIYHFHACENDRGAPGSGSIHWNEVKDALVQIGYDRWITLENFVMPECEVGKDTFIWRPIDESGSKSAESGILFLRGLFGCCGGKSC